VAGSEALRFHLADTVTVNNDRFIRNVAEGGLSSRFPLDSNFTGLFSSTTRWSWGEVITKRSFFNTIQNVTSLGFSNIRQTGPGYYEQAGFSFTPFYHYHNWKGEIDPTPPKTSSNPNPRPLPPEKRYRMYQNFGLTLTGRLPWLIPSHVVPGLTTNLPLSLGTTLFPDADTFWSLQCSIPVVALEIQRGVPLGLFFRRIALVAQYKRSYIALMGNESFDFFRFREVFANVGSHTDVVNVFTAMGVAEFGINTGVLTAVSLEISAGLQMVVDKDTGSNPPYEPYFSVRLKY
jgi:hypothetical protein